jgi:ATP-dependent helicase/nuclease subunit B
VVDYKRQRDRRLSLCEVYHGLALQLVTYLLALQEHGRSWLGRPVEPAGALYLPLLYRNDLVAHPGDAAVAGEEPQERAVKGRGLLDGRHFEAFDTETHSGSSPIVSAYIKRDGTFGYLDSTDVAQGEQFRAILEHVKSRITELGDRMFDGDVAVAPARLGRWMPCSYCLYRSVCRFDFRTNEPRTLSEMKRSEALDRMEGGCA